MLKESIKSFIDIHKNRNKILETLKSNKPLSIPELSKLTEINRKLIWAHMLQLYEEKLVIKDNSRKPTLWSLKNPTTSSEITFA